MIKKWICSWSCCEWNRIIWSVCSFLKVSVFGRMATPSVHIEDVEGRPAAFIPAPHKQLHIWAGRDASGEQRGGWGLTARRVNERGPEGDGSRQAPVVLLAAFRSRLWFLFEKFQVFLFLLNLFFCFCFFCFPVLALRYRSLLLLITSREKIRSILYSLKLHRWPFSLYRGFKQKPDKYQAENLPTKIILFAICRHALYHMQEICFCRDLSSHISLSVSMFSICFVVCVYVRLCKHLQAYRFIMCGDIGRHISKA